MIDIIIPTYKPLSRLKGFLKKMMVTLDTGFNIIPTCLRVSASTNRNYGLNRATSDIVIMLDDDIRGFYPGWAEGMLMPLQDEDVVMVSARLITRKGMPAVMMNIKPDLTKPIVEVKDQMLPSACIAFRNNGMRFDETYVGAGWEDTDFCMQMNEKYPNGKYMINNAVRLIHENEMKNQLSGQLQHNEMYFKQKWSWGENSRTD